MEKAIAIITARGGSKRIPRKNIKEFCGKPIIAYSIEAAKYQEIMEQMFRFLGVKKHRMIMQQLQMF